MKIGIFSDCHIGKRQPQVETEWRDSIISTFKEMYKTFEEESVDYVFCLGDFFDKSVLEARVLSLVSSVMGVICSHGITTYFLLGNHEIESDEHNILEYVNSIDAPVASIPKLSFVEGVVCIPYNVNIEDVNPDIFKDAIVLTHHDIYGSEIAGGRVKASFGIDPNIFSECRLVLNGHVHLRSSFGNIVNVGSLFTTQFGELKEGNLKDCPKYYILDTDTLEFKSYDNRNSLMYITVNEEDLDKLSDVKGSKIVRVLYKEELPEVSITSSDSITKMTFRKVVDSSKLSEDVDMSSSSYSSLDIKELIKSYISKDSSLDESRKESLINLGISMLEGKS